MNICEGGSPWSYRTSAIVWINGSSSNSSEWLEYRRLEAISNNCEIPIREVCGPRLSQADISNLLFTLKSPGNHSAAAVLIVGGLYLEDQISRCCLQALAEGHDTHILCDAVFSMDKVMFQTYLDRLTQAGVVPTSINQFAWFLIADEIDDVVVNKLRRSISTKNIRTC